MPDSADLAELDRRITAAWTQLTVARARFERSPSGEVVSACERAESAVNELLDRRFAASWGRTPAAPPLLPA